MGHVLRRAIPCAPEIDQASGVKLIAQMHIGFCGQPVQVHPVLGTATREVQPAQFCILQDKPIPKKTALQAQVQPRGISLKIQHAVNPRPSKLNPLGMRACAALAIASA